RFRRRPLRHGMAPRRPRDAAVSHRPRPPDYDPPDVNIAVASIKGGVGKTTTAVYLAAAAAERGDGEVVLVDADRQGSSAEWLEERPLEGVTVVEAPSERTLAKAMGRRNGVVVIDTPPGDHRLLTAAVSSAHAVVVP